MENGNVRVGDLIRIERRYVVNGNLTSMTDSGTYRGVKSLGSAEHLIIDDAEEIRLIPLSSVAEITLLATGGGPEDGGTDAYIR